MGKDGQMGQWRIADKFFGFGFLGYTYLVHPVLVFFVLGLAKSKLCGILLNTIRILINNIAFFSRATRQNQYSCFVRALTRALHQLFAWVQANFKHLFPNHFVSSTQSVLRSF
jgi:hypothetical protein